MTRSELVTINVEMSAHPVDVGAVVCDCDRVQRAFDRVCFDNKRTNALRDLVAKRWFDFEEQRPVARYRVDDAFDISSRQAKAGKVLREFSRRTLIEPDDDPSVAELCDRRRLDQASIKYRR
jgi:hypothetical protein